ncbi:MAG: MMPL family transporter, partial [Acidimicrobiia bacterium]|nr:MMPL family transporter [Acidimicrobiia bacterium]
DTASGQPPITTFLAPMESQQGPGFQVVVRSESGDVFTAEGLQLTLAAEEAVFDSPVAAKLVTDGAVTSFLLPVESAIAEGGAPADLATPGVKQAYLQALPTMPPEVAPLLGFLASNDADLTVPRASAGLIAFGLSEAPTAEDLAAVEAALASVYVPAGYGLELLPPQPSEAVFKDVYRQRLAFVPAEVAPLLDFLLSNDRDPSGPSASKGLVSISLAEELTAAEESSFADALASLELPPGFAVSYLPSDPSTAQLKAAYLDRLSFIPAEQSGLVENLLSGDRDLAAPSAGHGLMIVFLAATDPGDPDAQIEAALRQQEAVDAIGELDLPAGYEAKAFSFELIFASSDDSTAEIGRMFGLAALIILVVLLFNFWRRLSGRFGLVRSVRRMLATTLLTLLAILMAISIMQGIGVLLGPKYLGIIGDFNQIVQILPILLIGLGVDYGIHMTTRYQEELGSSDDVPKSTGIAIRTVGVALVLATATTVVGFLTNLVSPIPALKDFGILAAVGIIVSFGLMMTLLPAIRLLLDRAAARDGRLNAGDFAEEGARGSAVGALLAGGFGGAAVYAASVAIEAGIKSVDYGELFSGGSLGLFAAIGAVVGLIIIFLPTIVAPTGILAEKFPVWVVVIALVIGGVGWVGFQQLETRFSFTDFVPSDNPLLGAIDLLTEEFGGGFGETTSVLIEGDVATPASHNAQVAALEDLATTPDVLLFGDAPAQESVLSVLGSLIDPTQMTFTPEVAEAATDAGVTGDLRVPDDADVPALYAAVAVAAPERFDAVVHTAADGRYDAALWTINTQAGSERAGDLDENLNHVFGPVDDAGVSAIPTSQNIIGDVVVKSLQSSQVSSLWITLIAATLLLTLNFWIESGRPFLGVITMLPVTLVVLATFGTMAVTGIPFGPVTATISALAIGIAVPYTIHITHRFQEDRIRFGSTEEAIRSTTLHTGGALAGSALTTMAGFGSLVTSNLTPFQQFGAVTFYAIFYALAFSILLLPSMLVLWDRWHRRRGEDTIDESRLHEALDI